MTRAGGILSCRVLLSLLLVVGAGASPVAAQAVVADGSLDESLRGLQGVTVRASPGNAIPYGLTAVDMKNEVEALLTGEGIRVFDDPADIPGSPVLVVQVTIAATGDALAYRMDVQLWQTGILARSDDRPQAYGMTWESSAGIDVVYLGAGYVDLNLGEALGDLLYEFVDAYWSVNPKT